MAHPVVRHAQTSPGGPPPEVLAAAVAARLRGSMPGADGTVPYGAGTTAAARLLVTAGPCRGTAFAVVEPLVTIGRAGRNAVVIPDISVSREHLRLEKRRRRWILTDSASGNGTRVNGQAVRRRLLCDGDEIEIGDTALRFLESGGVIVWQSADGEGSARSLARYGRASLHAALVVAMILVLAAALVRRERLVREAAEQVRRGAIHALARQKLQEGLALLNEGRVGEGRVRLLVAAELDGEDAEIARVLQSARSDASGVAEGPAAAQSNPGTRAVIARPPPRSSRSRPVSQGGGAGSVAAAVAQTALDGRRALGERHLLAARELSADEDLPRAAAHLKAALENDPDNAAARLELERLTERVREIYLRAYVAKDAEPDVAREGFALVAGSLPAADELATRAARWLEKLDARSPR